MRPAPPLEISSPIRLAIRDESGDTSKRLPIGSRLNRWEEEGSSDERRLGSRSMAIMKRELFAAGRLGLGSIPNSLGGIAVYTNFSEPVLVVLHSVLAGENAHLEHVYRHGVKELVGKDHSESRSWTIRRYTATHTLGLRPSHYSSSAANQPSQPRE